MNEGDYAVDTNAITTHPAWTSLLDHTNDTSRLYLIANGAGSTVPLWQQTVNVQPGFTYNFSAWVADMCCGNVPSLNGLFPPSFRFNVTDGLNTTTVANFGMPLNNAGVWQQFSGSYANFSATSLVLTITNQNVVAGGNDLGVDDISFNVTGSVPEPSAWAMMLAGFGLVGFGLRRRGTAIVAA